MKYVGPALRQSFAKSHPLMAPVYRFGHYAISFPCPRRRRKKIGSDNDW